MTDGSRGWTEAIQARDQQGGRGVTRGCWESSGSPGASPATFSTDLAVQTEREQTTVVLAPRSGCTLTAALGENTVRRPLISLQSARSLPASAGPSTNDA